MHSDPAILECALEVSDCASSFIDDPKPGKSSRSKLEYIWLDGYTPTTSLRARTKIIEPEIPIYENEEAKGLEFDLLIRILKKDSVAYSYEYIQPLTNTHRLEGIIRNFRARLLDHLERCKETSDGHTNLVKSTLASCWAKVQHFCGLFILGPKLYYVYPSEDLELVSIS